jgi:hypothetical protein
MKRDARYSLVVLLPASDRRKCDQNSLQTFARRDDTVIW